MRILALRPKRGAPVVGETTARRADPGLPRAFVPLHAYAELSAANIVVEACVSFSLQATVVAMRTRGVRNCPVGVWLS
eukprot:5203013-Lingulodinium_polyedra.AAC.1